MPKPLSSRIFIRGIVTLLSLWFCFLGVRESIGEGSVVHAGNCHEGDLSSEILLISVQD